MPKNNTIIDKSHSKKELLHIINYFNIPSGLSQKNNKYEIASGVWSILSKTDYIHIPKDNKYLIDNIEDLRNYLKNVNPKKRLTVKEREAITYKAKKIYHYGKTGFIIENSFFEDIMDVYNTALKISKYGDLPMVRKSLTLLKQDPNKLYNIEPNISPEITKELHMKKKLKNRTKFYKCQFKHGLFVIDFS